MADVLSSLAVESITEGNSLKISKDLNDNAANNVLFAQLSDGTNVIDTTNGNLNVAISDGTNELDLVVIDSAYGATPTAAPVAGKYEASPTTYGDGDAVPFLMTSTGKLQVEATLAGGGSGGTSEVDDSAFTLGTTRVTPVSGIYVSAGDNVDDGDTGALRMTQDRLLYTQPFDGTNEMPMLDANTRAGFVQPTDGTNDLDYVVVDSAYGATPVVTPIAGKYEATPTTYADGDATPFLTSANGKIQSIVSANDSANGETNPIYVQVVDGALSGIEVIDYDTAASVAPGATSNHDYTVTATKTLKVKRAFGSSSGAQKIEIQAGPVAGLVTQGVQFTSQANLNWEVEFDGLLEVPDTSTGTVRIIRTNRETKPPGGLDLYSTIVGTEV